MKNPIAPSLFVLVLFLSISAGFIYTKGINIKQKTAKQNTNIINSLVETTTPQIDTSLYNATPTPTPIPTSTEPVPKFCIKMPVLMYHHIQPEDRAKKYGQESLSVYPNFFEDHLKYLKDHGYNTLDANELIEAINNTKQIPGKNVVITLDDGYADANEFALELAEKYKSKINIFIPTNFINKGGYLSWASIDKIKSKDNDKRKYAYFYNHSIYHRDLRYYSYNKIKEELLGAQNTLEDNIGDIAKIIAWPYGFYNETVIKAAKDSGFKGAFSTEPGSRHCDTNIYHLPRIRVRNTSLKSYGL